MKKQLKGLIVAAMMVLALPLQAFAASEASAAIDANGNKADVSVSLKGTGADEGVTSLQMTLDIRPEIGSLEQADVSFAFNEKLPGTVQRYRYNQEDNTLTIYVAGAKDGLFTNNAVDLGSVQVTSNTGDYIKVSITAGEKEDSLQILSAKTNMRSLTMQAVTSHVEAGTTIVPPGTDVPDNNPATATPSAPGATDQPNATQNPTTTPAAGNDTANEPSTGNNGTITATAAPNATSSTTSKKPSASKATASGSENVASNSASESSSSVASSTSQTSEAASSQESSSDQSTATNVKSNGAAIAAVICVVAVVVIAGAVVIIRRRKL